MAIINSEKQTQLLRKVSDNILDYEAMKLPISELRINDSSDSVIINPILEPDSSDICTWVTEIHSPEAFVKIKDVETNSLTIAPYEITTEFENDATHYMLNIYIKSSSNIPANTYKAVVIG